MKSATTLRVFWIILIIVSNFMIEITAEYQEKGPYYEGPRASKAGKSKRPHIIAIVADDLGYNDVSLHGSDQIPTPNIDFLAYNGVLLNNYYVSPICTPTRSALMTGRHPIHTGMQHSVLVGTKPYGLPLNETLMPQYLNKLDYRSHMVGKWHLGMFKWEYTPLYRGFESHFGYYQGCEDYYTHTYEANKSQWGLDFRRQKELLWNCTGQYSTTLFRDEALGIISRHDTTEPLFLYLPFQAVHSGNADGIHLQAPKEYIDKFSYIENLDRKTYAAMLSALDDAVGDIYDKLKQRDMLQNSIILFTTDNGGPANGFDYNAANNFPLRGVKHSLWEGGVRGVGLVHSPLLAKQGYVSNKLLHVCDWLPTFLSAAGGESLLQEKDTVAPLDGVDAWKMLSLDGEGVRSELLHNIDPWQGNAGIRVGDHKLLVGNIEMKWNGWYPPYQLAGDDTTLHYTKFKDNLKESASTKQQRQDLESTYRSKWPTSVKERVTELYFFAESSSMYTGPYASVKFGLSTVTGQSKAQDGGLSLLFQSETAGDGFDEGPSSGTPVTVKCGPKPANASTNCQPEINPCLFHIASDPCEYNNIAMENTELVTKMMKRISEYSATMVSPGNKPFDPAGNPKLHGAAWVPWQ